MSPPYPVRKCFHRMHEPGAVCVRCRKEWDDAITREFELELDADAQRRIEALYVTSEETP